MKTLLLLRHAESPWNHGSGSDFDRPLNEHGRRAARLMGREMRARHIMFDKLLASPAERVVQTIQALGEGYGRPLEAAQERRIYMASGEALLELVRETEDCVSSIMVVGHNPGLGVLAALLVGTAGGEAAAFSTATLAEVRLSVELWRDAGPGTGSLASLISPRDLDPAFGPQ